MRQFIRNIIVFSLALYMCLAKRNYFFQQLYFCSISFHNFMLPVFPFYLNTPFTRWRTGSSTVTQQQYKSINSNDIGCLSVIHCQDIGNNKVHVLGNLESSHQDDGSWVDVKEVYQKARSPVMRKQEKQWIYSPSPRFPTRQESGNVTQTTLSPSQIAEASIASHQPVRK